MTVYSRVLVVCLCDHMANQEVQLTVAAQDQESICHTSLAREKIKIQNLKDGFST